MIKNIQSLFYVDIILPLAVLCVNVQFEEFEQIESLKRRTAPTKTNQTF